MTTPSVSVAVLLAILGALTSPLAVAAPKYSWSVLEGPFGERTFDDRMNRAYCFQGAGRTEGSRVDSRFCRCTSPHGTRYQRQPSLLDASMLTSKRHPMRTTCFEVLTLPQGRILSVGGPVEAAKCDHSQSPAVPYEFCRDHGLMTTEMQRDFDRIEGWRVP